MKRGIIRIVSGVVLLVLQLLSIIGLSSAGTANTNPDLWFNIGFYSPAITGILLLIFGSRDYRNEIYSELILHSNSKKFHTVIKWVGFVLSTLLFIYYLLAFISSWSDFNIFTILNIFGFLSFSVYSLFYMYKKPSCLFSATMIFIGVAYIYGIISNLTYYILYLPDADYFVPYVFTGILPRLAAGILYIAIASIIHKESFSAKTIKVLGWTVFALEILNRVVSSIVVLQSIYFADLVGLVYLLFVIILMLYLSVFKINTLRDASAPVVNRETVYQSIYQVNSAPSYTDGWQCSCGRAHPKYETSCICGKSKFDNITPSKPENPDAELPQTTDKVLFCRKCGEKLIDNSQFCRKCGTEIVKE